ncbi:methyltransferase [Yersinia enterocolitica]|nr:methyltransferase [Yersinia enterocolitica]HEC4988312.1 methyltransferase [Yersinia enterocolitica]HEN3337366.1 methyltransferase [Yersinia enterocolitica]
MEMNKTLTPENEKNAFYLLEQVAEFSYQASLRAVAVLGIADNLLDGPKTAKELADKIGVEALPLHRVLRLLATRNIFKEIAGQRFELTPAAEFLCQSSPHSLREAVLMITDETFWLPLSLAADSVRGHCAFNQVFGTSFFEYWSKPENQASDYDFHSGMSSLSAVENPGLVRSYNFPENITVADIAGGIGGLLLRVLQANPSLHGILFDQEPVLVKNCLSELGDDSRWRLQSGNFFASCPVADIYLLKNIIHDWPDEKAVVILQNCRKAMRANGKVLIIDALIQEDNQPHYGKSMDIMMLACLDGGRERTETELQGLLADADLRINRIIATDGFLSIVEAVSR